MDELESSNELSYSELCAIIGHHSATKAEKIMASEILLLRRASNAVAEELSFFRSEKKRLEGEVSAWLSNARLYDKARMKAEKERDELRSRLLKYEGDSRDDSDDVRQQV